jgi:hypothetical protein
MRSRLVLQGALAMVLLAAPASADGGEPAREKPIYRGSTLSFDQSVTSETVGIGRDVQTRDPLYQLWLSFRPRIVPYEDDAQSVAVAARVDAYDELTNSNDTTRQRQLVWGDVWLTGSYSRTVYREGRWATQLSVGPRVLLPTSAVSQANGVVVTAGGGVGAKQQIPLLGGDYLNRLQLGLAATYSHPFTGATTAESPDTFAGRPRTGVDGTADPRTGRNDQLTGGYLVDHQLIDAVDATLQIAPRVSLSLGIILIHQWKHGSPSGCTPVAIQLGSACAGPSSKNPSPPTYFMSTWLTSSVDWQVLDAVALSVGYYNLTGTVALDGTRQSPFWAPQASRFFLTATASLDVIVDAIRPKASTREVVARR